MMVTMLNILVSVVLAPAVLAGIAHFTTRDNTLVMLSALLSAISGVVSVWDIVIRPGPKLGSDWRCPAPKAYLKINATVHSVILPVVTVVVIWLSRTFIGIGHKTLHWYWLIVLIVSCLWMPQSKSGPDAGILLDRD